MTDRVALTKALKTEARRLGFSLVGVTTAEPPLHLEVYERWLEAGCHGEMNYMASERARQRRSDPRQILEECQSILILAVPYSASMIPAREGGEARGRVAAYAWGEDYHKTLPPRLHALAGALESIVGEAVPNRWYSDTGPILERELAQRAGLGWIGKNTCLINPRSGSYFLLAEILLGIDLEPDQPFEKDYCGACSRCLEACPTSCILPDRTLDARRCLSYLTIELKGAIPRDMRRLMGNWIFGCDICQQVCPWNRRFASVIGDQAFMARPDVPSPELITELALSPSEFNRKFRHSPVIRAKRRGYLRNVATVLGGLRNPGGLAALSRGLLEDPEPLVRAHAAWAVGELGGEQARERLLQAVEMETDREVLAEIRTALGEAQDYTDCTTRSY